jgi:hypothetical protein
MMKNLIKSFMLLSFLLMNVSTCSMDEKGTHAFNSIIAAGRKAEDQGNAKAAENLYIKAYRYKKFEKYPKFEALAQAVVSHNTKKERKISTEIMKENENLK